MNSTAKRVAATATLALAASTATMAAGFSSAPMFQRPILIDRPFSTVNLPKYNLGGDPPPYVPSRVIMAPVACAFRSIPRINADGMVIWDTVWDCPN